MHQKCPVTDPTVFLRIFNIDRSFSNTGLSFGIRFQGHYRPVPTVAWLCCRVIFTQDQLSDSAMDAIGADEYITVMSASIRTIVFVRLLENDKYKELCKAESPGNCFQLEYSQVDGQRPVVIAIHTFQILRSVHAVRGYTCQQLAEKCSAVYNSSELTRIGTM